jgi:Xaa-Pro aminopeptidase
MSDYMMKRLKSVKEKLVESGLDSYLVGANDNKRYFVGFEDLAVGVDSFLLITPRKDYLIVEICDDERAQRAAPHCEVLPVADKEPLGETVRKIAENENLKRMGYERKVLKAYQYNLILDSARGLKLIPVENVTESMRMVKDPEEVENIAKAVEIGDAAFTHVLPFIKAGAVEKDLAWEIEAFGRNVKGADSLSFPTIVASGINSSLPHGLASDKKIETGDFVTLDFGFIYNGYCGDMTRTVVIGEPSPKHKEVYHIVLEAQQAGVKAAKAGMRAQDLDKVARDIIAGYGYGEYFTHELGHSLGIRIHEDPWVGDYNPMVLEPGMVVTIEPGIYIPGWAGVRIEDTVVIQEGGCRVLTKSTKELLIV